jgi:hypothetical protein
MQASSDPLDPRAVLGAVKAQPGNRFEVIVLAYV